MENFKFLYLETDHNFIIYHAATGIYVKEVDSKDLAIELMAKLNQSYFDIHELASPIMIDRQTKTKYASYQILNLEDNSRAGSALGKNARAEICKKLLDLLNLEGSYL